MQAHSRNSDYRLMNNAFSGAIGGLAIAAPNPAVGAILYHESRKEIIAAGHTLEPGNHHAEIAAIEEALKKKADLSECTLYVTLEPCCHHGRTPPCTDRIIKEKIPRVVIATRDPSPKVNGKGIEILLEHQVEVELLDSRDFEMEIEFTLGPFLKSLRSDKPWYMVKWAQDADGNLAPAHGPSGPVSSAASHQLVHRLRKVLCNTLVTPGTINADNPRLNARLSDVAGFTSALLPPFWSSVYETLLKVQRPASRIFCLPRIQKNWSEKQLIDFIHLHKSIDSNFLMVTSEALSHSVCLKMDVKVVAVEPGSLPGLAYPGNHDYFQLLVETGPASAQTWALSSDLLLVFNSDLSLFPGGKSTPFSKEIAETAGLENFTRVGEFTLQNDRVFVFKRVKPFDR